MGNLTDEMRSLVSEINTSKESRRTAVSELRSDTHNLAKRFQMEQREVASDIRLAGRIWRHGSKKK